MGITTVFPRVAPIFPSVSDVLQTIRRSALVPTINTVFGPVTNVLSVISTIFAPVRVVLDAITRRSWEKRPCLIPDILATIPPILPPIADILSPVADVFDAVPNAAVMPAVVDVLGAVADVFATVVDVFPPIPDILKPVSTRQTVRTRAGPTGCARRILPVGSLTTDWSRRIAIAIHVLRPIRMVLLKALVGFRMVLLEAFERGLAMRLPARRHLFVLRRIRALQLLQTLLDPFPARLKRLMEGFRILLLQPLQALLSALPELIGDPGMRLRVGLLQMRQALPELGLMLLHGLLKRFRVLLLQLPKPVGFLGNPLAPTRLAVVGFLRHRFLRSLFLR